MNEWLDGWMTNLSFQKKKHARRYACILYRKISNKEKKRKLKKENKTKQPKNTINSVANMQEQQQSDVTIPK